MDHVYTRVPGAVGHYAVVEGDRWWISPSIAETEWCVVGGYVLYDHPYIDGAPVGWRRMWEPFGGFDRPLPTNRLGFEWQPGRECVIPMWAVMAGTLTAAVAAHGLLRDRSGRARGFPIRSAADSVA